MKVIAPCLYPSEEPAKLLRKSCVANGLELILYGQGETFKAHGADAQVTRLIPVLQSLSDDIVIITDARDSLMLQPEPAFMHAFNEMNSRLVMSTEKGHWPYDEEVLAGMPSTSLGYNYINAGQYMGERTYIIHCLKHLIDTYEGRTSLENSQAWWPVAFVRGELDFALDSECKLFQTMSSGETVTIDDRGVCVDGRYPCSIHFNGDRELITYNKLAEELCWNDRT